MGTNTLDPIDLGTLVIKRAPTSVYNPAVRQKLVGSLELARRAISVATEAMRWLAVKSQVTLANVGDVPYQTLRRHFALGALPSAGVVPDVLWTPWAADVETIARNLHRIELGLSQRVTIADAQSTEMARLRRNLVTLHSMDATLPDADDPQVKLRLDQMARLKSGTVAIKKEAHLSPEALQRYLAGDASVRVEAKDKGSIHVNFATQLADMNMTYVQVANTIIHEASHKFADTRDFYYSSDDGYATMTKDQAMLNADSYAFATICLYKKQLFVDETSLRHPPRGLNMNQ